MSLYYQDDHVTLYHGDCIEVLGTLPDASVDAVVTDPPYGLEFMGKGWDAPWEVSDVNADAGFSDLVMADGFKRLPRPSYTGSTNPKCLDCGGTRRGRRDGTAKVRVCLCADGGRFPNHRATEMRAFQGWCEQWAAECLRVLKPGGHMVAFGGTRTFHRLTAGIEDAGFEIRDVLSWLYGSGFPKSMDVSKAIDKAAGAEREVVGTKLGQPGYSLAPSTGGNLYEGSFGGTGDPIKEAQITAPATPEAAQWEGWGTALKPAWEPIVLARKPLAGTVAGNVLTYGTGAINIDACRIGTTVETWPTTRSYGGDPSEVSFTKTAGGVQRAQSTGSAPSGRWPANVLIDDEAGTAIDAQTGVTRSRIGKPRGAAAGTGWGMTATGAEYDDEGGASRFFYSAKADAVERPVVDGVAHPTVKPLALMEWLIRLVTPPGGTVLEPFAGSGTTLEAAQYTGHRAIGIEKGDEYLPLIVHRLERDDPRARAPKPLEVHPDQLDLLQHLGGIA